MQRHEVAFQVEVRQVLAVKELRGQLLQTAAGQVHGVHPLGGDLTETGRLEGGGACPLPQDAGTLEAVRCQRRCSVYES